MYEYIRRVEAIFQPTAVGSNETKGLFNVKAGERVLWASCRALIAAAAATDTIMTLGDGTSVAGYIASIDLELTVAGTIVNGQGVLLNQSGGKLYTVDDTVDVVYSGTTYGATNPKMKFVICLAREI